MIEFTKSTQEIEKKNFFSKKYPVPGIQTITKNILEIKKIREKRRRGRVTVEREDSTINSFCAKLHQWK